ncbi:hypothetical protein McpCs1_01530 [Methanocorpusculaceae archaeon Cs1]|uniref:Uncharacterized protein n=1 Tax=Methanorbis rubei TaxID=3028300 RepID=A0AAE4MD35_9EURY|nr:hypothetical protein [Methanocorpusculaceae archaeon Cs1]
MSRFFSVMTNRFIHQKIRCRIMSHKEAKKAEAPKAAPKAAAKVEAPKVAPKSGKKN